MPKGLHFRNVLGCREVGRGRVGRGGGSGEGGRGWVGHSDVNLKSAHAKTIGSYSMFDDFAWVRHVPHQPSSAWALDRHA